MPVPPRFSVCEIDWVETAEKEVVRALTRLAHLNQTKVYMFWEKPKP